MEVSMKDGKVILKKDGKTLELASRERLDMLLKKEGLNEMIDKLAMRYLDVVIYEIEKMDLKESDKILVEVIILERVNRAFISALGESCKMFGVSDKTIDTRNKEKSDEDALECFSKVTDKILNMGKNAYGEVRKDILQKGKIGLSSSEAERIKKEAPLMILDMCKHGEGKEFVDFSNKVMDICVKEINRLGRHLTREEVFEICEDIKRGRK